MSLNQSKNVFKQIFIDHWAGFLEMNREYQAEYYDTVIKRMLGCGNPEHGWIVDNRDSFFAEEIRGYVNG